MENNEAVISMEHVEGVKGFQSKMTPEDMKRIFPHTRPQKTES